MLTEILDFSARARARILAQYADLPRFSALVGELSANVQQIEAALFDLIDQTAIGTATGVFLEQLGELVGEPRGAASDALYRRYIRARVRADRSSGTFEDVIAVVTAWYGGAFPNLVLTELGRASLHVDLDSPDVPDALALRLAGILPGTRSAAVGSQLLWQSVASSKVFKFATGTGLEADSDAGFGDSSDVLTGGVLRSVAIV